MVSSRKKKIQGEKVRRYDLQLKQDLRNISSNHMHRHYVDADSNKMKLLRTSENIRLCYSILFFSKIPKS